MDSGRRTAGRRGRATGALAIVAALAFTAGCGGSSDAPADSPSARDASGKTAGSEAAARSAPRWNPSPASVAALGDSITTGFDSCKLLADCPEVSWATGTDPAVDSLARRLLSDPTGRAFNHAVSGAVVADLPGQAAKAVADKPELVTILIGANDACADKPAEMTSTASFRRDLKRAVGTLRSELPETQLFVASIPDLRRLWSEGSKVEAARNVWQMGVCQSMLQDPLSKSPADEKRRGAVAARVTEYNTVLKEVCETDARCRHDGGAVHEYPFEVSELSRWDYFHPSKRGQQILARVAHRAITAPA
ncbi:GDSL-type esterase/lipase family protein [Streptomyces alkaliterrae]|uniref:SGNH/GDSL hydrolase family protein n=1 Tax=Streptomyces alkaliterrae TaxID=2213162 RepID=A0A5P0YRZ6_9ACTN|nr:GDSL-type esterase/lipase family protein [Streptomyces alkaliterrae]MBB1256678.1 SGNH/GDSL hydrolase family protein [Streptomyces alkaliterrae]MBB1260594.1 SGNH/GDSL hydrolase family protein [Streptomyces alkaliterrae]MQS03101.1 SGNH/GDSL hydrolase family protein [Streptomyces alkaliterrae]